MALCRMPWHSSGLPSFPPVLLTAEVLDPEKPGGTRLDLAPDDSSPLTVRAPATLVMPSLSQ